MIKEKHCPNCQQSFECTHQCWCSAFPPIVPLEKEKGCLCPDCLKQEVIQRIDSWTTPLTKEKVKTIQQMGLPTQLIEGIDYTINEAGFYVFTSWYLLRQGKCCGNGCQNCPYQKIEK
ncbi:hypothetical protein IFO69_18960 [Echinicola sp. CAU 1574]|uniref:Cysteine-rich CWC n=1 Tax=Echinicola arenosa TaxID=2774144 RepID=A0ABR9AQ71_9BACT|nr:DUF5522 domain-containing protein [Echinicola arenosa]MBD8490840.1 hypothetical protein [Echinicola arenosa]